MFTILIFTYFFQLILISLFKSEGQEWRKAFVKSIVILFVTIVGSTELLAYFNLLKTGFPVGWWTFLNLILLGYSIFVLRINYSFLSKVLVEWNSKTDWFSDGTKKTIWILLALIYLTILFTALSAPPNTVDVLTYHFPRIAQWIQSGNLHFFPTSNERQLFNPPLTEYFILQLQILAGNDRFANLVPFTSFITLGVLTSLLSQKFKLNTLGQLFTALISASIPLAIIQASSSKNDIVVSLFVVAFFYYFLNALEENKKADFLFAGLALGLAFLTKGNSYFFCFPIGLIIVIKSLFKYRFTKLEYKFLLNTVGILLIAITINFGHYYRNWELYHSPIKGEERLTNEKMNPSIFFGNVFRNYVVHLGTSFEATSEFAEYTAYKIFGPELNDPATTLAGHSFLIFQSFHEDLITNPLHLFLLTCSLFYVFFSKEVKEFSGIFCLAASILFGFLLLSTLLKWNYWIARIQLPLFFLGSSIIANLIINKVNKKGLIIAVFGIGSFFTIYLATPRSLIPYDINCVYNVPRDEQYFSNNLNLHYIYQEAIKVIQNSNAKEIGLDLSNDYKNYNFGDYEYPFWLFLHEGAEGPVILRHVGVEGPSKIYNSNQDLPEWVISTTKRNVLENVEYEVVWARAQVRILRRK